MIPSLPISGLKREEIYTFLSGLYVALSWTLYVAKDNLVDRTTNILFTGVFMFIWLTAVIIVYLLNSMITVSIAKITKHFVSKKGTLQLKKILQLGEQSVYYFFDDYSESLLFVSHISILIFLSVLLSLYPVLCISVPIVNILYSKAFWLILVLVLAYLLLSSWLIWRQVWAFSYLYETNIVLIVNRREFGIEGARFVAGIKIEDAKIKIEVDRASKLGKTQ